jgi:hypothetical protein
MFDLSDDLFAIDPTELPAADLAPAAVAAHGVWEQARLRLVRVVDAVDAGFEYRAAGHASAAGWLRAQVDISDGDAVRLVALARHLRRADVFAAAVDAGALALARAEALLRPLSNHRVRALFLEHQAAILEQSAGVATRDLPRLARQIEAMLDTDGDDPERDRPAESTAAIVQNANGRWSLRADLCAEHGALFNAELQAIVEQLRQSSELEDLDDVPKGARLRGAAMAEMAARGSGSDQRNPAAPTASIIVPLDTLDDLLDHDGDGGDCHGEDHTSTDDDDGCACHGEDHTAGDGDADGSHDVADGTPSPERTMRPALLESTPLTKNQLRRLLCDCLLHKVLVDSNGAILDLGRAHRTASKEQRLFLALRDGGCVFPGCHQRPGHCRAHHIRWWKRDLGPTDISNLALTCDRHHELIHCGIWSLEHVGDGDFDWTHTRTGRVEHRRRHEHWLLQPA